MLVSGDNILGKLQLLFFFFFLENKVNITNMDTT